MSYFDSPKNKAIWEREMKGLRAERERREREGYKPQPVGEVTETVKEDNPFRRKLTVKELEEIVAASSGRVRRERPQRKEWNVSRNKEKEADVMKGREM